MTRVVLELPDGEEADVGCGCAAVSFHGPDRVEVWTVPFTSPQLGNVDAPRRWGYPDRRRRARPVMLQLLSRREVIFDARANTVESVPLPTFGGAPYSPQPSAPITRQPPPA